MHVAIYSMLDLELSTGGIPDERHDNHDNAYRARNCAQGILRITISRPRPNPGTPCPHQRQLCRAKLVTATLSNRVRSTNNKGLDAERREEAELILDEITIGSLIVIQWSGTRLF
jgi:hypothetical protein